MPGSERLNDTIRPLDRFLVRVQHIVLIKIFEGNGSCLLYTSDAADDSIRV